MGGNFNKEHIPPEARGMASFDQFDAFPSELRRFLANFPFNAATDDIADALALGYTPEQIMQRCLRVLNLRLLHERHYVWGSLDFPVQQITTSKDFI